MQERTVEENRDNEWLWSEYYDAFPYFTEQNVRKGCHPRKLIHENTTQKAIVLIHGLSDSSYYMLDIAEYFHKALGYDVYVPLLQGHGLEKPEGMKSVSLREWKENVRFSIRKAQEGSDIVSIGGLSMGGALAFNLGCVEQGVNGDVYLFAAAFGLASGRIPFGGKLKELLLRLPFITILEPNSSFIGENPYRYNRVSTHSAVELVRLMVENNKMLLEIEKGRDFGKSLFSAWSESDDVVDTEALKKLKNVLPATENTAFEILKEHEVDHACLVLGKSVFSTSVRPGDQPLEQANPLFCEMVEAISRHDSKDEFCE